MNSGTKIKKDPPGKRLASRRNGGDQKQISKKRLAAFRWWVGTVVLTLIPTLFVTIIATFRVDTELNMDLILNDGDLVLSSFLIVTSTFVNCYNTKNESLLTEVIRVLLFLTGSIQLVTWAVFKTNTTNNLKIVAIVSIVSLLISISSSWTWYLLTNKGVYDDEPH